MCPETLRLQMLYYRYCVPMSGTPFGNQWTDIEAPLFLLKTTPFPDQKSFTHFFMDRDTKGSLVKLTPQRMAMLIVLLQSIVVARSGDVLDIPGLVRKTWTFTLKGPEADKEEKCMKAYFMFMKEQKKKKNFTDRARSGMICRLVRAYLATVHEELANMALENKNGQLEVGGHVVEDDFDEDFVGDMDDDYVPPEERTRNSKKKTKGKGKAVAKEKGKGKAQPKKKNPKARGRPEQSEDEEDWEDEDLEGGGERQQKKKFDQKAWREKIPTLHLSSRIEEMTKILEYCRQIHPNRKVVYVAKHVRTLDLLEHELKRKNVKVLRYHGEIDMDRRRQILKDFENADDNTVLLMSADAGGLGINVICANIIVLDGAWWNSNQENQAIGRLFRNGQERVVYVYQLLSSNSKIEPMIMAARDRKSAVNAELKKYLYHRHDTPTEIPEVDFNLRISGVDGWWVDINYDEEDWEDVEGEYDDDEEDEYDWGGKDKVFGEYKFIGGYSRAI